MEPGAEFDQRRHPSIDLDSAGRRLGDPRQKLEQRRLAGPIGPHQRERLAVVKAETHVSQGPMHASGRGAGRASGDAPCPARQGVGNTRAGGTELIALRYVREADSRGHGLGSPGSRCWACIRR